MLSVSRLCAQEAVPDKDRVQADQLFWSLFTAQLQQAFKLCFIEQQSLYLTFN